MLGVPEAAAVKRQMILAWFTLCALALVATWFIQDVLAGREQADAEAWERAMTLCIKRYPTYRCELIHGRRPL